MEEQEGKESWQREQRTQQCKEDAVRYKKEHPELSYQMAASNLNISISALKV